jgi:hypothetical protein
MPIIPPMQTPPPATSVPPVVLPRVQPKPKKMHPNLPKNNIPSQITITPITLPSTIEVVNENVPSHITGPDIQIPSQVILHNVGKVSFEPFPPMPPLTIMPPLIPPLAVQPVEMIGPSFISLLCCSSISLAVPEAVGVSLIFPSIIGVQLDFPNSIGVNLTGIPESIPLTIESLPKLEIDLHSFKSMLMDVGKTLADVLKEVKVEIPKPTWQFPELKVDWGDVPKLTAVVKVKKAKSGGSSSKSPTSPNGGGSNGPGGSGSMESGSSPAGNPSSPSSSGPNPCADEPQFDEFGWLIDNGEGPTEEANYNFFQEPVESQGLEYPSEFIISPPEIPPIQVQHSIPHSIAINQPEWKDIQIVGADKIPTGIHIIPPEQDMRISVVPFKMPDIRIDSSSLAGTSIPVKFPAQMPALRVEMPFSTIRVEGIPDKIIAEVQVPENVRIPLFYDGPPLPVQINLQVQGLAGEAPGNNITCVAIMPCPMKK